MQFIDKVKLKVKAGNGGDGIIAFAHEKYNPLAGPSGGDGGSGGSIIFEADSNKSTLLDLRYQRLIKANNGERGKTNKMYGASAEDVIIKLPLGSVVKDINENRVLADLTSNGQQEVIAKGGKGGKGNRHYATSRNTAPEKCELGEMGEEREIEIELKVLADVGLLGLPSVGKSTLISMVSAAKPEIADYPFTTLTPQLGMVRVDGFSFVMADLPGLIVGASEGKGLGHEFLRHMERCRLLVHVLDMGHEDPIQDYEDINQELLNYPGNLNQRKQLVVANKMDEEGSEEKLNLFKEKYPDVEVFPCITLLNEGLDLLLYRIKDLLPNIATYPMMEEVEDNHKVFTYEKEKEFEIINEGNHYWRIESEKLQQFIATLDLHQEADALRFGNYLKKIGVDQALRDRGCVNGDTIAIAGIEFDFDEGEL